MFPHTHKIISEHLHESIVNTLGVELNKNSLIYGSIKPDIAPSLAKLDHFKPQSFELIMNEIHRLSQTSFANNKEFIKNFSSQIGVVTHFIADFFCVPHNDRIKYRKATIVSHMIYENNLHKLFKDFDGKVIASQEDFTVDNYSAHIIKRAIEQLHQQYNSREESFMNDLTSSLEATSAVGLYIVRHAISQRSSIVAA
ncbi:zinc dependent phospholipase C family protein [Alkaliphilus hydrothermalis]|uniref:Phospholipase C/D domain-containing protein n=1 Tax=Alkaliphilus hydrothermalis TaxID=1482730 RepID=A0ABS2NUD1_9FIRM|nr:zinc dependent phospholipase C family protein [Alkaliphilus hydrothermalis]MBM7616382.1 hypothetical protein [Alkaliphilus hydrothermalis]